MSHRQQPRHQRGSADGGKFATKSREVADPTVTLDELNPRSVPADFKQGLNPGELGQLRSSASALWERAKEVEIAMGELELAHRAVDLYEQHGISSVELGPDYDAPDRVLVTCVWLTNGQRLSWHNYSPEVEAAEDAMLGIPSSVLGQHEAKRYDLLDLINSSSDLAERVRQGVTKN